MTTTTQTHGDTNTTEQTFHVACNRCGHVVRIDYRDLAKVEKTKPGCCRKQNRAFVPYYPA